MIALKSGNYMDNKPMTLLNICTMIVKNFTRSISPIYYKKYWILKGREMGHVSKETFKKLTLLYLIGRFKEGIYTNYRVQKTLYYSIKNVKAHPFTYQHTQKGEYSFNAKENLNALMSIGLIEQVGMPDDEDTKIKWSWTHKETGIELSNLFRKISPELSVSIDKAVEEYGYLKRETLETVAHSDDLLTKTPYGHILFEENLPDKIEVNLSEEDCQDLELNMNPRFVNSIRSLIEGIDNGEISLEQWRKIDA
jgi:hypothetical protein